MRCSPKNRCLKWGDGTFFINYAMYDFENLNLSSRLAGWISLASSAFQWMTRLDVANTFKWSAATPQLLEVRLNGYSASSWLCIARFYYDVIFTMSSTEGRLGTGLIGKVWWDINLHFTGRSSSCKLCDGSLPTVIYWLWIHETKKHYLLYIIIRKCLTENFNLVHYNHTEYRQLQEWLAKWSVDILLIA